MNYDLRLTDAQLKACAAAADAKFKEVQDRMLMRDPGPDDEPLDPELVQRAFRIVQALDTCSTDEAVSALELAIEMVISMDAAFEELHARPPLHPSE